MGFRSSRAGEGFGQRAFGQRPAAALNDVLFRQHVAESCTAEAVFPRWRTTRPEQLAAGRALSISLVVIVKTRLTAPSPSATLFRADRTVVSARPGNKPAGQRGRKRGEVGRGARWVFEARARARVLASARLASAQQRP